MTTPPTPSQAKTREEWDAVLGKMMAADAIWRDDNKPTDDRDLHRFAEIRDSILDAIMSLQASETNLQAENQELYQSLCSTNTQYGQLEEAEKELRAEVERLRAENHLCWHSLQKNRTMER